MYMRLLIYADYRFKTLLIYFTLLLSINTNLSAQNVGIGTDFPNSHSILELRSDSLGVLISRMTTNDRDSYLTSSLSQVDEGLLIYNLSSQKFNYWDGTKWVAFPNDQIPRGDVSLPQFFNNNDFNYDLEIAATIDGRYIYVFNRNNRDIFRLERQSYGSYIYTGITSSLSIVGNGLKAMMDGEDGIYIFTDPASLTCEKFNYDLTSSQIITGFAATANNPYGDIDYRNGFFYFADFVGGSFSGILKYTILGNTSSLISNTPFTIPIARELYLYVDDNENYYFTPRDDMDGFELRKYDFNGNFLNSINFRTNSFGSDPDAIQRLGFQQFDIPVMSIGHTFFVTESLNFVKFVEIDF